MAFQKFILPTLALCGYALAQCDGDITIENNQDAEAIADCVTYEGNIVISEVATGTIQLNGVRAIDGDLTCDNATGLNSISSDQLATISGKFDLSRLTILSGLQFDALQAVNEINWVSLAQLQSLNFGRGISKANKVQISDTGLTSLNGIELEGVAEMNINNNRYMTEVDVNALKNVTRALTFAANSDELKISLPNLESAANLTFINVSDVSMPSLSEVGGAMGFYFNTFESFSAPNLTETGSDIAFVSCANLNNISFPELTIIGGGFLVANNSELTEVNGFPQLKTIAGALDFAGVMEEVKMPKLGDVRGGSNVQSTTDKTELCDAFNQAAQKKIIKGSSVCKVNEDNPETIDGTSTSGESSSSSSSEGAANPAVFDPSAPLTGLTALIAALLFI